MPKPPRVGRVRPRSGRGIRLPSDSQERSPIRFRGAMAKHSRPRSRRCCCAETSERPTAPAVLPAVSYREVRLRQRRGVKLPGQRILLLRGGGVGASRHRDYQHQRGRGPGSGGRVNSGEAVINVVTKDKRKMLSRLGQRACGQVRGLLTLPTQMAHHRRRAAALPTRVHPRNVVSPSSPRKGQRLARGAQGTAGTGRGRTRMPACNGSDRG